MLLLVLRKTLIYSFYIHATREILGILRSTYLIPSWITRNIKIQEKMLSECTQPIILLLAHTLPLIKRRRKRRRKRRKTEPVSFDFWDSLSLELVRLKYFWDFKIFNWPKVSVTFTFLSSDLQIYNSPSPLSSYTKCNLWRPLPLSLLLLEKGLQRCIFCTKLDTLLPAKWPHSEFGDQTEDKEGNVGSQDVPSINLLKSEMKGIL